MRIFVFLLALFAVAAALAPTNVRADIKVNCAVWLDQDQWKALQQTMPAADRAKLTQDSFLFRYGGAHLSLYQSGEKMRVDTPDYSVLMQRDSSKMVVLNYQRQVAIFADCPAMASSSHSAPTVRRTGKTMVIHGHTAHLYQISIRYASLDIEADDWVAEDMPFDNLIGASSSPVLQSIWGRIKGLPLWSTVVIAYRDETLKINYEVESISTEPIAPDTFAPPAGFRKIQVPDNAPDGKGDPGNGVASLGTSQSVRAPLPLSRAAKRSKSQFLSKIDRECVNSCQVPRRRKIAFAASLPA